MRLATTRNRGFTLVELVTTIVLIGVVSAVAVPRFFDSTSFNQRGYADEVASALRVASKVAIASQCEVRVTLTAVNYTAAQPSTIGDCGSGGGGWGTQVFRNDGSTLAGSAPKEVTLAPAAITVITFDASGGTPVPPPALTIGPFTLTVDPVSGTVTVTP